MTLYGLKKSVEHLDLSNGSRMEVGYSLLKNKKIRYLTADRLTAIISRNRHGPSDSDPAIRRSFACRVFWHFLGIVDIY